MGPAPEKERTAPESEAGLVSRLFFLWVLPFVRDAWAAIDEGRFSSETLPPLPVEEHPEYNVARLRKVWDAERQAKGQSASLPLVCLKFMGPTLALSFSMVCLQALLLMSGPLMVTKLLEAIQGIAPPELGFLMCALLTLATMTSSIVQQGSWHMCSRSARQCWLALSALIFEKPARLSSGARADITEGELINMMSVDAGQVLHVMQFFAVLVSAPMFVLVPTLIIPLYLGWPYFVGLAIFVGTTWLCERLSNQVRDHQMKTLKAADGRSMRLNESFQGIRTVKMNAWESLMEDRVEKVRVKEMGELKWYHIKQSLQQAISFGMPTAGTVVTFMLYGWNGGSFAPADVFLCVALFEFLTTGVIIIPWIFNLTRQLRLHIKRIEKLLLKQDDFQRTSANAFKRGTVQCLSADFCWDLPTDGSAPSAVLSGVTLEASPGEMVAICGRVGSGKTTWAGGLLGLVSRTRGTVDVSGSVAYVTQAPQILNDTIRENILFGLDFDEDWYAQVLRACALEEDLKQFTGGDMTEIGEKGITISGGQKQRVAIARAAYSRADVMVFDDPLSAMDAHVGKLVFDKCFRGILANHTRIFFTNQLHFCSACSQVVMLESGRVAESGTYSALQARTPPGPFAVFLHSVIGASDAEEAVELNDVQISADVQAKDPNQGEGKDGHTADGPGKVESKVSAAKKNAMHRTMSKETKIGGRIGFGDWMQVARASNAAVLGFLVILFSVASPAAQYAVNLALGVWTNAILDEDLKASGSDPFEDPIPSLVYISSALLLGGVLLMRGCLCVVYFLRSSKTLHRLMLTSTLRQTMSWFDTTPVGRVMSRFGNDVQFMDILLPMMFQMWSLNFFRIIIIVVFAGITAPPALVMSVALLLASKVAYSFYGAIALEVQRVQQLALGPLLAAQSGFLGSLDSIRCFDRVDVFVRRFSTMQNNFVATFYWAFTLDRAVQCLFTTVVVSVFFGSVACALLLLSVYETPLSAFVTPGSAGAILAYCSILAYQVPVTIYMSARVEQMMSAVQRIAEYKDQPTEDSLQNVKEPVPASWPAEGTLSFEEVDMRYRDGLPLALKGVTFSVAPGERVGIVGRTGSGKSSIILTCFRMVNACGGKVSLDGRDLARVPLKDLRSRLGVIPQDSWLFSGTVRSNLDVCGKFSDRELWDVLRLVELDGQAKTWKDGLDHEVKEKGENLSTGTAQLLCLARVLLKRPSLLFMDEATASVDAETDKLVQETIRKPGVLPSHCSIVTIAHRLHTVIDYDRIVLLSRGRVLEDGPPAKLLENGQGEFTALVDSTGAASSRELRRRCRGAVEIERSESESTVESGSSRMKGSRSNRMQMSGNYLVGCFSGLIAKE